MKVVVVDYGMGNLRSVRKALVRVGHPAVVSAEPEVVATADRLVLPGVGHFATGMANLRERGLDRALQARVISDGTPILGICLGMQLMTESSEEGDCAGLGWLAARTVRFAFDEERAHLRVPHIGWNTLSVAADSQFLGDVAPEDSFYFTHSYHLADCPESVAAATTEYGEPFVSAIHRDNIYGTQFHPEKSHRQGLRLLSRFLEAE
jgi:glutamine amidotransferase